MNATEFEGLLRSIWHSAAQNPPRLIAISNENLRIIDPDFAYMCEVTDIAQRKIKEGFGAPRAVVMVHPRSGMSAGA